MVEELKRSKKVVAALSGGVDSCVAAALLVEQGYEVIGVSMRLWSAPGCEQENRCCTPETREAAHLQAQALGIPFEILDASQVFRDTVVETFLSGYACGDTPNPCIICNRRVKWELLMVFANAMGAGWVATGHYARIIRSSRGDYELRRGVDHQKDQSYFLCLLTQAQLARTLFPLGELRKEQVRELARKRQLPAAELPESQDLCFLGGVDYRAFILKYIPHAAAPGPVVNRSGQVLGQHHGLAFYTTGQRKGLPAANRPLYVLHKDLANNQLVVGFTDELGQRTLRTSAVNWIAGQAAHKPLPAQVQIRSRALPAHAWVHPLADGGARVDFEQTLRDITPGQMAVFYEGERVLGGGVIQSVGDAQSA